MTELDEMTMALRELNKTEGVIGSGIIRRDGLLITAELENTVDEPRFGMMSSSLLGSAKTTQNLLELGGLHQVVLQSQDGHLIVTELGDTAILVVTADPEDDRPADSPVFIEIEETVDVLEQLL